MRFLSPILLLGGLLAGFTAARVCVQAASESLDKETAAQPWQIAGIRAAFGDPRVPFVEHSAAVQNEALKLCVEYGWAAALDAQETATYLDNKDAEIRLAALNALGQMGKEGGRFAKKAAAAYKKRDFNDAGYFTAIDVFGQMAVAGAPVADEVLDLLSDGGMEGRDAMAVSLHGIGSEGAPLAAAIAGLLNDESSKTRSAAADALGAMGPVGATYADQVAGLLGDKESTVRAYAAGALGSFDREGARFATQLAARLEDPDEDVRSEAAKALGKIEPEGAVFAKRIAVLLDDRSDTARMAAAEALAQMGAKGAPYAKTIAGFLVGGSPEVRGAAAEALSEMGPAGSGFAKNIAPLLSHKDENERHQAAFALARMGNTGPNVAKVIANLAYPSSAADTEAATALQTLASGRTSLAKEFADLLKSKDPRVRGGAATALSYLGDDGVVYGGRVAALLQDDGQDMRGFAAQALGRMDKNGTRFAVKLGALIGGRDEWACGQALYALSTMGEHGAAFAKAAAPLLALDDDNDYGVRRAALEAMDHWGNPGGDLELQAALLAAVHAAPAIATPLLRAHLRLWAGGNAEMQRSITWLAKPDITPMPKEGLSPDETRQTLGLFLNLWDHTAKHSALRKELSGRIGDVARRIDAKPDEETQKILSILAEKVKDDDRDVYAALLRAQK